MDNHIVPENSLSLEAFQRASTAAFSYMKLENDREKDIFHQMVIDRDPNLKASEASDISNLTHYDHIFKLTQWDWPGWVPQGQLIMIASQPGMGKSAMCLRFAQTYIQGLPWPDGSPFTGETGDVLWCESENGERINWERALKWNIPRQHIQTLFRDLTPFDLEDMQHFKLLIQKARNPQVKAIIIDSLRAATKGDEDNSRAIRYPLLLSTVAQKLNKPIFITHHLRKRSQYENDFEVNLDDVRGSSALTQPTRIVIAIEQKGYGNEVTRRMRVIKSNLGLLPDTPIAFKMEETGPTFSPDTPAVRPETQVERAIRILRAELEAGPRLADEMLELMNANDISERSAKRAKAHLGVISRRKPVSDGGQWTWELPPS